MTNDGSNVLFAEVAPETFSYGVTILVRVETAGTCISA
jgi:hypothetical protein